MRDLIDVQAGKHYRNPRHAETEFGKPPLFELMFDGGRIVLVGFNVFITLNPQTRTVLAA
jgi:hypothetical protein